MEEQALSEDYPTFAQELADVINKYSRERFSDTPDFILATYIRHCLAAYEYAIKSRQEWHISQNPNSRSTKDGE